ncbi:hypothetical protein JFL43_11395 [Viridibacillus sp. YIM B01967]|uniref:RNA polymerase II n=1 Tax=Viridibacillus soli TaxID=2798301 RepID=A0ABS1H7P6_9BACL|nr:hypothetical protein [Viridibacillus soli]MBK3495444.1 hypothetical protein [Viridibacillus soli]
MKFAASLFSILLFLNGIMLSFQYHVYSDQLAEEDKAFSYDQEIEVIYRKGKLIVNHYLTDLPKENMKLIWPTKSKGKACFLADANSCERLNEQLTQLKAGDGEKQAVSYEIPLSKKGLTSGEVLRNIFLTLQHGTPKHTKVHITDETKSGGQWFTGLQLVGQKSLDLVQYSMFSGFGTVTDLYWQKHKLKTVFENEQVTLYSDEAVSKELMTELKDFSLDGIEHVAIMQSSNKSSAGRILFTPKFSVETIEKKIVMSRIGQQYDFKGNNNWLPIAVASFITEREIGSDKALEITEIVNSYMSNEQSKVWKKGLIKQKGETISPKSLDQLLSETIDLKTSFFEMNDNDNQEVAPLLFEDARKVYMKEIQDENMQVIFKDGRILYKAEPLLNGLGYEVREGRNGLYIESEARQFRFPMTEPFYVYNEKRYDTISQPFEKFGDDYYVEEAWLVRLFLVDVEKSEDKINIAPSDILN